MMQSILLLKLHIFIDFCVCWCINVFASSFFLTSHLAVLYRTDFFLRKLLLPTIVAFFFFSAHVPLLSPSCSSNLFFLFVILVPFLSFIFCSFLMHTLIDFFIVSFSFTSFCYHPSLSFSLPVYSTILSCTGFTEALHSLSLEAAPFLSLLSHMDWRVMLCGDSAISGPQVFNIILQ